MRVLYIDSFFFMNLAVNYLMALATAKICALKIKHVRFLLAAAFGAAYAVVTVLPGAPGFFSLLPIRIAMGVLIALISFGAERRFGKLILIFFAMAACFAGTSMALGVVNFQTVLLAVAVTYTLLTAALKFAAASRRTPSEGTASIKLNITLNNKSAEFRVLRDTGNSLRDQGTGSILPIVNFAEVSSLFQPEIRNILYSKRSAADKFTELAEFRDLLSVRLIPYRAVGLDSGLLIGFKADSVQENGTERDSKWAAISPTAINSYGGIL